MSTQKAEGEVIGMVVGVCEEESSKQTQSQKSPKLNMHRLYIQTVDFSASYDCEV